MNKPKITFIVDVLLLLSLVTMASLSLLLKFVLIPAKDTVAQYGRQVELSWFGLDRQDWGAIHFSVTLFLLALLVVRLILHWPEIVNLCEQVVPNAAVRTILAPLGAVLTLLLIFLPLLAKPDLKEVGVAIGPPATPAPAPVSETEAVPPPVQPSPKVGEAKTASLTQPRPKKISRTSRYARQHAKYRYRAHYGKWGKGKPRFCPRRPYLLAARSR